MKAHFTHPNMFIYLFYLIIFVYSPIHSAPPPNSDTPIKIARDNLKSKYDSLDLEKQKFKRNGLSIVDLEIQQDSIRDSLKILQQIVQNAGSISEPTSTTHNNLSLLKPQNAFDWIILIIGIVALFSGVLLLYGIFSMVTTKFKKRAIQQKKAAKVKPPSNQSKSAPISQSIAALKALSDSTSDPVIKLRQKIQTTESSKAPKSPEVSSSVPVRLTPKEKSDAPSITRDETAINQKVISAADSGMSLHDISRKFHISTDHVALILKVAKRKQ